MKNGAFARLAIPAAVVLLVTLMLAVCQASPALDSTGQPRTLVAVPRDPVALVDPFTGTGTGGAAVGGNNAFPGATLPFGMIQWSPDTPSRPPGGGYSYSDSSITGFSLTHVSGAGCPISGAIPILPVAGALPVGLSTASASFKHSSETAHPGYYAVTAGGVHAELAVTERSGVAQFTYPANSEAQLLVKVAASDAASSGATFQESGDGEITGSVTTGNFCHRGPDEYTTYFAARFSRPIKFSGTWSAANGKLAGAWLDFGTMSLENTVGMQVAISYVSTRGALANLAAEARTWSVQSVAAQATAVWSKQLSVIGIGGGSSAARAEFYTALYHASLEPSLASDVNGQYLGFDGKVHPVAAGHAQYADFSGWDIYRCEVPLLATTNQKIASDMATSLLNDAVQGGSLPRWPVENADTGVMGGDSADPILADFYAFGARGFNAKAALSEMIKGADGATRVGQGNWYTERPNVTEYLKDGYVSNGTPDSGSAVTDSASETLEYAIDDFSISRLAGDLGDAADAAVFARRSQNWENLFDTANGYIEPRDASGAFPSGPPAQTDHRNGQDGFQEGNAAQYTWMVPQNLAGLIKAMGGDRAAVTRLDTFFAQLNVGPDRPYAWQGNEPGLDTPWIYDTAAEPWKTQALVRRITSQLYSLAPGGEPGNDDLGALSSWYVWAALGLYPQTPGVPMLVLGTPQFPYGVIHGAYGQLTITTSGAGGTYIRGLTVNGTPSWHTYIDLNGTGKLDFTLSTTPDTSWGSAVGDTPPSFGAGPVHFLPRAEPGDGLHIRHAR